MPSLEANLETLFRPWIGAADDDEYMARYDLFNSNDKASVIAAVRADLLPDFFALSAGEREPIRSALVGAQTLENYTLERMWDCMLPPFSLPENHQAFYAWVDEALAGDFLEC